MTTERKQLIAELWQCMPFYQPGSQKIADEQIPVPVELLERVMAALAASPINALPHETEDK